MTSHNGAKRTRGNQRPSPLLLVVGTGRCGSTLLTEVLARHPDLGFISNIDDKLSRLDLGGRWNNSLFRMASARDAGLPAMRFGQRLLERGRVRVAPSEGWNLIERQVGPMLVRPSRDLVADDLTPDLEKKIRSFFEERMAIQGRPGFLHHITGWPRTRLLQAVFPEARIVHVVRDGRAVANSFLQMGWWDGYRGPDAWYLGPLPAPYREEWEASGRSFVLLAGLAWKMLIDSFEASREAARPGSWIDVRYEDVIADPHGSYARLLEFGGLEWTGDFERGFNRHRFETGATERFRRDLGPQNLARLEASLAGHLERWGYAASRDAIRDG
ncbi:MAG: sulfotransferase family protein [Actinomycetota bacterium]